MKKINEFIYLLAVAVFLSSAFLDVALALQPSRSEISVDARSQIPLLYRDESGVYPIPVHKSCLLDLGFAICDGRHPARQCWEFNDSVQLYQDQITDYSGIVFKTIRADGLRGVVFIDFNSSPFRMSAIAWHSPLFRRPYPTRSAGRRGG